MPLLEEQTNSFIIKIWLEPSDGQVGEVVWRGHITHVPSHERRYIRRLSDIADLIQPYLDNMGVQPSWTERLRRGWRLGAGRRS